MKSVEEIKLVFTSVLNAATVQSKILLSMQLKQKHRHVVYDMLYGGVSRS
jgi:hypothetical protein